MALCNHFIQHIVAYFKRIARPKQARKKENQSHSELVWIIIIDFTATIAVKAYSNTAVAVVAGQEN